MPDHENIRGDICIECPSCTRTKVLYLSSLCAVTHCGGGKSHPPQMSLGWGGFSVIHVRVYGLSLERAFCNACSLYFTVVSVRQREQVTIRYCNCPPPPPPPQKKKKKKKKLHDFHCILFLMNFGWA